MPGVFISKATEIIEKSDIYFDEDADEAEREAAKEDALNLGADLRKGWSNLYGGKICLTPN